MPSLVVLSQIRDNNFDSNEHVSRKLQTREAIRETDLDYWEWMKTFIVNSSIKEFRVVIEGMILAI